MIKNLVNILTSPTEAFKSISEKPTVLAPFVLLLGVAIFTQYWVMYTIDFDYFSGTSTLKAVLVVLIPMVLIYGIWLSFLLL